MKKLLHLTLSLSLALPAAAQIPNTLLYSLPAPVKAGVQSDGQLGSSIAIDGNLTVVGAPDDDIGGTDSGVVKVFDSTTGALLFLLPNPTPEIRDFFGISVAVSGTRVVIGADQDDTGASDAGSAYVYDLAGGTPTVPIFTLNNPGPAVFDLFGTSVAISGTRVVIGARLDSTGAASAGSAYVYDLAGGTPTVPVATLNNPSPTLSDGFGNSVAISGLSVVIAAYLDDGGATDAGTVYAYDLAGGTPTVPILTLNNPAPATNDRFGSSVAISGTRVAVGAHLDDTGATDAGAAYVYDLAGGTPTVPLATFTNPTPAAQEYFGGAVAISGTSVAVGAYFDGTGATNAGSTYVYDLGSGTPTTPVLTLNNPSPAASDAYGRAVALSGARLAVGAYGDNTGAQNAGSAYVYDLGSGTPTIPTNILNDPGPVVADFYGFSIAVSGTRLVVGAYLDDAGANNAGRVYVYDLSGGTPTVPIAILSNPVPAANDYFGKSVAIDGTRVVVGADGDDTLAASAGSAYVFDLSSGTPTVPIATLNHSGVDDRFGISVGISGNRIVVGANLDDTGGTFSGRAFIYDLTSGTPTVPAFTLNNPSPAAGDWFGTSVSISGSRVVVGALRDNTGASDAGSAYVFDLTSGTPTIPTVTLSNPTPAASDYFGAVVSISGARLVVGAPNDNTGASDAGSAYVYDLTSGTPATPIATLNNPSPAAGDFFGGSVAISGTKTVVGAYFDDATASDAGTVYAYDLSSSTPTVPVATLSNPTPAGGDRFGASVTIDGTTVAVGAHYDDTSGFEQGAAYVYGPHPLDQDSDGLRDAWELAYWPSATGHGPLDDEDHDGIVNLMELALGLNPTLPSPGGLPPVTDEGGYLTMTLTKLPGVTYQVQSAGTLLPGSFSTAGTTVILDNAATLKVRDNFLISTNPVRFMRVQVTAAP